MHRLSHTLIRTLVITVGVLLPVSFADRARPHPIGFRISTIPGRRLRRRSKRIALTRSRHSVAGRSTVVRVVLDQSLIDALVTEGARLDLDRAEIVYSDGMRDPLIGMQGDLHARFGVDVPWSIRDPETGAFQHITSARIGVRDERIHVEHHTPPASINLRRRLIAGETNGMSPPRVGKTRLIRTGWAKEHEAKVLFTRRAADAIALVDWEKGAFVMNDGGIVHPASSLRLEYSALRGCEPPPWLLSDPMHSSVPCLAKEEIVVDVVRGQLDVRPVGPVTHELATLRRVGARPRTDPARDPRIGVSSNSARIDARRDDRGADDPPRRTGRDIDRTGVRGFAAKLVARSRSGSAT